MIFDPILLVKFEYYLSFGFSLLCWCSMSSEDFSRCPSDLETQIKRVKLGRAAACCYRLPIIVQSTSKVYSSHNGTDSMEGFLFFPFSPIFPCRVFYALCILTFLGLWFEITSCETMNKRNEVSYLHFFEIFLNN